MTINRMNEGNMIKPGLGNSDDAESDDEGLSDMDNTMGGDNADESRMSVSSASAGGDPSAISDRAETAGPSRKVVKERGAAPKGREPKPSGTMGPGESSGSHSNRNTMGHGERVATGRNTLGHK